VGYSNVTMSSDGTLQGSWADGRGRSQQFRTPLDLLWIQEACQRSPVAAERIWSQQDGYLGGPMLNIAIGQVDRLHVPLPTPVTIPAQDRTGIEYSSRPARAVMLNIARLTLPSAALGAQLNIPSQALDGVADAVYGRPPRPEARR
jgi:hypothetical protein